MLFEDEDESRRSDKSYVPSDYDSSFDGKNVEDYPADASTLKSRNCKEIWSIAPITSSQGITGARNVVRENSRQQGMLLTYNCLLLTVSFYFF